MMPAPTVPKLPEPTDLPKDADGNPLGGDAKWTAYRGAHQPCHRCIRAINQGVMHAHPHPARRKRAGVGAGDELLCLQHGEAQETRDALVKRKLAVTRASTKKRRA